MHGAGVNTGAAIVRVGEARGTGWCDHRTRVQRRVRVADVWPVGSSLTIAIAVTAVTHGEWESGLPVRDSRYLPAAKDLAHDSVLGTTNVPHQGDHSNVATIEVRVPVINVWTGAQHLRYRLE